MSTARAFSTATLLSNGQVLMAGGLNSNWDGLGTADVYDPTGGTFTATGSLNTPRGCATANLLNTGQVLVTGGFDSQGNTLASGELYDPIQRDLYDGIG
jgi:hypothetical protein